MCTSLMVVLFLDFTTHFPVNMNKHVVCCIWLSRINKFQTTAKVFFCEAIDPSHMFFLIIFVFLAYFSRYDLVLSAQNWLNFFLFSLSLCAKMKFSFAICLIFFIWTFKIFLLRHKLRCESMCVFSFGWIFVAESGSEDVCRIFSNKQNQKY